MILDLKINLNDRIFLRELTAGDASEKYLKWLNDFEVTKFTEQRHLNHTIDSIVNFINLKKHSKNEILLGIFFDNLHIGNVKLGPINWEHMTSEISYFIGEKEYWNKGIATICVKGVVEYAISEFDIKKINAGYYETNESSAKVFKKCGFKVEGIRKSNVVFNGNRIDTVFVGFTY